MHSLLKRQLKRNFGELDSIPAEWHPFLKLVDEAYREFDADRMLLERSLEFSSHELLQANSELRAMIQAFPDLFIWIKDDSTILDCKGGAGTDLLLSIPDLIGKRIVDIPNDEIRSKFSDAIKEVITKKTISSIDYPLEVGGKNQFFEARLLRLRENQILVVIRNITDKKQIEEQLANERRNLEATVTQRTSELRDMLVKLELANQQLLIANQHKNQFLSTMSHELRTPLNAVIGYTDLLVGRFYGPLNNTQYRYINQIGTSGKHLLALINDLLDLARIDAGRVQLEYEKFSIPDLVSATCEMVNNQLEKKSLLIQWNYEAPINYVYADRRKVMQILLNFLTNAIKYTPEHGKITIKTEGDGDNFIKIKVSDTGHGIEKHNHEKIFDDFFQTDRVRDEQLGGVGIGLALTRRLVHLHGGNIGVESEYGQGSTFWFSLPIRTENMDTDLTLTANASDIMDNTAIKQVLLIDNEPMDILIIKEILSVRNYNIDVIPPHEFLSMNSTFRKPDIIMVNLSMNLWQNLEVLKNLQSGDSLLGKPIIGILTEEDQTQIIKLKAAGCQDFITKPIQLPRLFNLMDRYL